ncbi:MAG: CBS domain-containing protein [Desulfuromonadaceae bacterium]|nr:CBS domain-containing protein [Desulfuromonadaceae bacterium]MDD2847105.1 CBS domain-containing protein [Desulfuromonadaceae bacterium]MDD4128917.1 CBS domain-containing protein [Desulfuromonadaceae bacterium]
MLTVADIMTRDVVSIKGTTTVREMAAIFDTKHFGTLPILDDAGNLAGIVTTSDLVEQDRPLHIPTVISIFDWVIPLGGESALQRDLDKITAQTASELASTDVITVTPTDTVSAAAEIMSSQKLHTLPVVDGKKLVGVVSRIDIIRSMNR